MAESLSTELRVLRACGRHPQCEADLRWLTVGLGAPDWLDVRNAFRRLQATGSLTREKFPDSRVEHWRTAPAAWIRVITRLLRGAAQSKSDKGRSTLALLRRLGLATSKHDVESSEVIRSLLHDGRAQGLFVLDRTKWYLPESAPKSSPTPALTLPDTSPKRVNSMRIKSEGTLQPPRPTSPREVKFWNAGCVFK